MAIPNPSISRKTLFAFDLFKLPDVLSMFVVHLFYANYQRQRLNRNLYNTDMLIEIVSQRRILLQYYSNGTLLWKRLRPYSPNKRVELNKRILLHIYISEKIGCICRTIQNFPYIKSENTKNGNCIS